MDSSSIGARRMQPIARSSDAARCQITSDTYYTEDRVCYTWLHISLMVDRTGCENRTIGRHAPAVESAAVLVDVDEPPTPLADWPPSAPPPPPPPVPGWHSGGGL